MHTKVPRSRSSRQRTPQPRSSVWKTWRRTLMPLWTRRFWQRERSQPHHGPHSYNLQEEMLNQQLFLFSSAVYIWLTLILLSPWRYRRRQPVVTVAPPSPHHGDAGAVLSVPAAIVAVTADPEQPRTTAQEAAVRPAVLPVAKVWGPGAAIPDAQLHRRRLHPSA